MPLHEHRNRVCDWMRGGEGAPERVFDRHSVQGVPRTSARSPTARHREDSRHGKRTRRRGRHGLSGDTGNEKRQSGVRRQGRTWRKAYRKGGEKTTSTRYPW